MCKCGKRLLSRAILLTITALLVACGGDDKAVTPAKDLINEPAKEAAASSQAAATSSAPAITPSSVVVTSSAPQNIAQEKDTTPPSSTQLLLQKLTQTSITLTWDDATDNARINTYKIERNGQLVATLSYPADVFTDVDLQPYTAYTYTITAVDSSGNDSKVSSPYTVRTLSNSSSSKANAVIGTPTTTTPPRTAVNNSTANANSSKAATSSKATSNALSSAKSSSSKATSSARSSAKNSSSKAASSKYSTASSAGAAAKPKAVKITWSHPQQRENGQFLELQEIGGYEIRYRNPADATYSHITVNNNATNEYTIENADGLEFEIAAFDINGIYSQFVKVTQ